MAPLRTWSFVAWLALFVACKQQDPLDTFVERACACSTPECSDAVGSDLDRWLDQKPSGKRDREHDSSQLDKLAACQRRFENARRTGAAKVTLPPTPAGEPYTIGSLTIPTPVGFHATGNRFVADGPIEWVFFADEPAGDPGTWLEKTWPTAISPYQKVNAQPIATLPGGPGWTLVARTASCEDRYGHPLVYMVIAAYRPDTGRVYPSHVEAPAPLDRGAWAAIQAELPKLEVRAK